MIAQGDAYYCFCSAEQLGSERQEEMKAGRQPRYSGRCRKLSARRGRAPEDAAGEPAAVRLKIVESSFFWNDRVHGPTTISSDVIGDPVLVRSEGLPAYNYAVVIDDHLMEITHVIRGDDHISNTPRQLAVYRALGWEPPRVRAPLHHSGTRPHTPFQAPRGDFHGKFPGDGNSSRGAAELPGAAGVVARRWKDGNPEPGGTGRAVLARPHHQEPGGVRHDKLNWLNRHYMKECPPRRLAELAMPFLSSAGYLEAQPSAEVMAWLEGVLNAVLKNLSTFEQLPDAVRIIFDYDARKAVEELDLAATPSARAVLGAFIPKALAQPELSYERFRALTKEVQKETGNKGKDLFHPIRVALTGAPSGPELEKLIPIFEAGAKLQLPRHLKSVSERLSEFASAASI